MIIRLQHQRSDGESDLYHLKSGRRYHIGRGSGCEVRILDLKLSRKHCAIEFDDGWKLVDLASTNGCKLDGEPLVGTAPLQTGSVIVIGQTELSVTRILADDEVDEDTPAPPEPAVESSEPVTKEPTERVRSLPSIEMKAVAGGDEHSGELKASDWAPTDQAEAGSAVPAANGKKGNDAALVPNGQADDELAALRKAAQVSADRARSVTGQLQRLSFPTPQPGSLGSAIDKPLIARNPIATPKPDAVKFEDSGPFRSLSPRAPSSDDELFADDKPAAKPAEKTVASDQIAAKPAEKRPGTSSERRVKPKVVPIIIQAVDSDEDSPPLPTTPAHGSPILASNPAPTPPAPKPVAKPAPRVTPTSDLDEVLGTGPKVQPRSVLRANPADDLLDLDGPTKATPPPLPKPAPRVEAQKPAPPPAPAMKSPDAARTPPRAPVEPPRAVAFEQDLVKTLPAFQYDENKAPPPKPAAPVPGQLEEKPFFITVLGKRVGPLTREKARDLKARELKGTLTAADLEPYT